MSCGASEYLTGCLAHVSEDGKDLVAISEHGCLYYIDNFERLIQPESVASSTSSQREKEVVWFYQFRPIVTAHPAFNLAFEKGRIAMTCVSPSLSFV